MPILKDDDRAKLVDIFGSLPNPVSIVMFTQAMECQYCQMTRELLEEVAGLSELISLKVVDFLDGAKQAEAYAVDKIPATIVEGDRDYGIRFYGVPAGYEFTSLIDAIVMVGRRDHGLPSDVVNKLSQVDQPVHMQAMVTPTCPYCPRAVHTAHQFAMASEFITGDMVEITEYPHLAIKYGVQGVPNTIINDTESMVGAQPAKSMAEAVLKAIGG